MDRNPHCRMYLRRAPIVQVPRVTALTQFDRNGSRSDKYLEQHLDRNRIDLTLQQSHDHYSGKQQSQSSCTLPICPLRNERKKKPLQATLALTARICSTSVIESSFLRVASPRHAPNRCPAITTTCSNSSRCKAKGVLQQPPPRDCPSLGKSNERGFGALGTCDIRPLSPVVDTWGSGRMIGHRFEKL